MPLGTKKEIVNERRIIESRRGRVGGPRTAGEVDCMSCVADVMTKEVVTVTPDTSLRNVAKILAEKKISGVPVVDGGKVVGIVSEADILKAGDMSKTAGEVMVTDVIAVGPEACVTDAAAIMSDRGIKRLPVLDAEGKLVGIISRADVVRAMASK